MDTEKKGTVVEEKAKRIIDLLPKSEEETGDEQLLAKLVGKDGKLKVDLTIPERYHEEIMAEQLVDAVTNYEQARQAHRSARNSGDNSKAEQLYKSMNYYRLLAAIIQAEHRTAKALADDIMVRKARAVEIARKQVG